MQELSSVLMHPPCLYSTFFPSIQAAVIFHVKCFSISIVKKKEIKFRTALTVLLKDGIGD